MPIMVAAAQVGRWPKGRGYLSKPISVRDLPRQVTEFLPERPIDD
jgi:hypothetical protein